MKPFICLSRWGVFFLIGFANFGRTALDHLFAGETALGLADVVVAAALWATVLYDAAYFKRRAS